MQLTLKVTVLYLLFAALTGTALSEEDWGHWWLVLLPAFEEQANTGRDGLPSTSAPTSQRLADPSPILQARRSSAIKRKIKTIGSHARDQELLNVRGYDGEGNAVFNATVKDPRVVRMETLDDSGNLIDFGITRRGSALVSIPVPIHQVERLEIFSKTPGNSAGERAF